MRSKYYLYNYKFLETKSRLKQMSYYLLGNILFIMINNCVSYIYIY